MDLFYQTLNGDSHLSDMMKKYKATPWCECKPGKWAACSKCSPPILTVKEQGPQGQGGDLFQHSQWCTLYIKMWGSKKMKQRELLYHLIQDLVKTKSLDKVCGKDKRLYLLELCGFFHDIGKGGDKVYDVYNKNKYGKGRTDDYHPVICGDIILRPGKRYGGELKRVLTEILSKFTDPKLARKILALCAFTHWELGKLNMPVDKGGITSKQYIKFVYDNIKKLNIKGINKVILLKMCMICSCADIASAYNNELVAEKSGVLNNIDIENMTHLSDGGAWVKFNMNKNHTKIIKKILKETKSRKKTKKQRRKLK